MTDINLGKVKVEADTEGLDKLKEKLSELKEGVPSTGALIDKFVHSISNIPGPVGVAAVTIAALGAAMVEMVAHTLEAEQQLLELSETTGISVEGLQVLQQGLEMSGVSSDKLTAGVGKLAAAVGKALEDPTSKSAEAFRKLGVSQELLKSGDTEAILKASAEGFSQYADSINKTAAEREIFGKGGPALVAGLVAEQKIAAEVKETMEEYGTAVTKADTESAKHFNTTLALGTSMFKGVALTVTNALLPTLQSLASEFAASGKKGGEMRDILDGLATALSFVAKVALGIIVPAFKTVTFVIAEIITGFKTMATVIDDVIQGKWGDAATAVKDHAKEIAARFNDLVVSNYQFEKSLIEGTKVQEEHAEAAENAGKVYGGPVATNLKKLAELIAELNAKFLAQKTMTQAAAQGLEQYREAESNATIAGELAKLKIQEGTVAARQYTEAYKRLTEEKQKTAANLAADNQELSLRAQLSNIYNKQTEEQKVLNEITKNGATAKDESNLQIARAIDLSKQQQEVDKLLLSYKQQTAAIEAKNTDALSVSNKELARRQEFQKLDAQYQKDIVGKTPEQVEQIAAAWADTAAAQEKSNQDFDKFSQSAAGAFAGAKQAVANFSDGATNANKIVGNLTTKLEDDFSNAIVNSLGKGKNAWADFAQGAIKAIEQIIVKMLVAKAVEESLTFLGSGGVTSSSGAVGDPGAGAIQYAASGIVTSATMVSPGVIAGEMGNSTGEAVLPLVRTTDGSLGVKSSGGGSGSGGGGATINNVYTVNVDATGNQDPNSVAKAVANQMKQISAIANAQIAKQLLPGGLLNSNQVQGF